MSHLLHFEHRRRAVTVAVLAIAAAVAIALLTARAGAAPTEKADVQSIGGTGHAVGQQSSESGRLEQLRSEGIEIVPGSAKLVDAPAIDTVPWVISAKTDGGVCLTLTITSMCGAPTDRARGLIGATFWPADSIIGPFNPKTGIVKVAPSTEPGTRRGIAPDGAATIEVVDDSGQVVTTGDVDRGLYAVPVPHQQSNSYLRFAGRDGSPVTADVPLR